MSDTFCIGPIEHDFAGKIGDLFPSWVNSRSHARHAHQPFRLWIAAVFGVICSMPKVPSSRVSYSARNWPRVSLVCQIVSRSSASCSILQRILSNSPMALRLKPDEFFEVGDAFFDFGAGDFGDAGEAEAFAAKGGDDGSVNHGATEVALHGPFGGCEIAHHAANEGVAGAGGIDDGGERISGGDEEAVRAGEDGAVLAFLDDDVFWPELVDGARGGEEVRVIGQLLGFALVEDKSMNALEEAEQVLKGDVEPEVHGVGDDELGLLHLVEHMHLQRGRDIGEEDERGGLERVGQMRGETFKHAQLSGEGAAVVHVQLVFAGPMEGFAGLDLESVKVDAMAAIELDVALGKVLPDDADELDGSEETGGDGGVTGGTAEEAGVLGMRGFDGVQGGGTDN